MIESNNFSLVIPIYNESINIKNLISEIIDIEYNCKYEILIVNDGGSDNINISDYKIIDEIFSMKILNHNSNFGQSAAIRTGALKSKYDTIITMDGDGQNDPKDILNLLNIFVANDKVNLVQGIRNSRKDNFSKKIGSFIANSVRTLVLKDNCRDSGCALRVFNKDDYLKIVYFDHMHRYLPYLFLQENLNVKFENVSHRKRMYGKSNYSNIRRLFSGLYDLFGVIWLMKRKYKVKLKKIL